MFSKAFIQSLRAFRRPQPRWLEDYRALGVEGLEGLRFIENLSRFLCQNLRIFGSRIVSGTVLEVFGSTGWLQKAPRQCSEGAEGPKSRPQEMKRTANQVPSWPKRATRRLIWTLWGAGFDEILVKMDVKMRRFWKRRT